MTNNKRSAEQIIKRLNNENATRVLASIQPTNIDTDNRSVELAFSSANCEVMRWFGYEILGHDPGEICLDRLNDGAAFLLNHDPNTQIGIVENARIDKDGVGRATVRFGNSALASEIFQDVQDGIRRHVSVGYIVYGLTKLSETKNDLDVYRVTDWEPTEISLVSVPADPSVGVGRGLLSPNSVEKTEKTHEDNQTLHTLRSQIEGTELSMTEHHQHATLPNQNTESAHNVQQAIDNERKRVADITAIARQYNANDLGIDFVNNPNGTVEGLQRALLERTGKSTPLNSKNSDIGMEHRDLKNYSVLRAVRALTSNDPKARSDAGFEFEVSQEAAKRQKVRQADGLVIPSDVLRSTANGEFSMFHRDMNIGSNGQTGAGSTGSATVANNLLAGSYIDILRNKAVFARGIHILGGLVGNISIPKQTGTTQGYWLGEGEDVQISSMDFEKIDLTPKTAAAYCEITRRFLEQSSLDAENLIRADMAKSMALTIDFSGYYGTGSPKQPLGLANIAGVNKIKLSQNQPSFEELVTMETLIAAQNADTDRMRYIARPDFRGYAKTNLKFPGMTGAAPIWEAGDTINGYKCDITNQVRPGDVFMGNFGDVIMGMWGGLELIVDPYTRSRSGSVIVTTFQDIDWNFRRPESFALAQYSATDAKKAA